MADLIKTLAKKNNLRGLMAVTAIFTVILYIGVNSSLNRSISNYTKELKNQEEKLLWMKQAAVNLTKFRAGMAEQAELTGDGISLSVINSTANDSEILPQIKEIQPDGKNRVRISIERASFNGVTKWLQLLSQQGINVRNFAAERQEHGLVNARITLESLQPK